MKKNHRILILAAAATLGSAAQTQAAVVTVITPTGVSFTDTTGNYASPDINRLINGSGISPAIGATVNTATLASFSVSSAIDDTGWRRNGTAIPAVDFTFTMSAPSTFNGILIANYWEGPGLSYRGVSAFGLQISTDGGTTYSADLQTVNPSQSTGNLEYISLGTTYTGVTNIKFNDATYFSGDGAHIMGLNEVRFTIPEPSAAALAGLAGLGLALRRRRAH